MGENPCHKCEFEKLSKISKKSVCYHCQDRIEYENSNKTSDGFANRSPCFNCVNRYKDKEDPNSDCFHCEDRIKYHDCLVDPRDKETIDKIKQIDEEAEERLKDVDFGLEEDEISAKSIEIERRLTRLAGKHGFDDYIDWIEYLYCEKNLSVNQIANKASVSHYTIRKRMKEANKYPIDKDEYFRREND